MATGAPVKLHIAHHIFTEDEVARRRIALAAYHDDFVRVDGAGTSPNSSSSSIGANAPANLAGALRHHCPRGTSGPGPFRVAPMG